MLNIAHSLPVSGIMTGAKFDDSDYNKSRIPPPAAGQSLSLPHQHSLFGSYRHAAFSGFGIAARRPGGAAAIVTLDLARQHTAVLAKPTKAPSPSRAIRRGWSEDEIVNLTDGYEQKIPLAVLALQLGRTIGAIGAKAYRLGLRKRKLVQDCDPVVPKFDLQRTKTGRMVWNEPAVRAVADLWVKGYDHKCIGTLLESTPASVRSIASRRGMPDRSGYTLLHSYDPTARALDGLADRMYEKVCKGTGVVFFLNKKDRASVWYCPAFKASKKYKASFGE